MKISLKARAKLNLTLEILGKRDDGYHNIASIMQTLDLADDVTIRPSDSLDLRCGVPELGGRRNLAWRAADLLRSEAGVREGAAIEIRKRIPIAAGLGGGSADAAAVLVGLNRMWKLGLPPADLRALAARVGSDVPFLIEGGTAMAAGRGELIRDLPPAADLPSFVIAVPKADAAADKTARMYAALPESARTRGALTRKLEARIRNGGDVPPQYLFNAFDDLARDAFPEVRACWDDARSLGAREIHICGSGPAIYAAIERKELATTVHLVMDKIKGWRTLATRAAPANPIGGDDADEDNIR